MKTKLSYITRHVKKTKNNAFTVTKSHTHTCILAWVTSWFPNWHYGFVFIILMQPHPAGVWNFNCNVRIKNENCPLLITQQDRIKPFYNFFKVFIWIDIQITVLCNIENAAKMASVCFQLCASQNYFCWISKMCGCYLYIVVD